MDFPIQCRCGAVQVVSEGSAGARLQCPCGASLEVPSLRDLREGAGLTAVPVAPEKAIPQLIERGDLPPAACVTCGMRDVEAVPMVADCERTTVVGGSSGVAETLAGLLISPFLGAWLMVTGGEEHTVHGRETIVAVPLPLCRACHHDLPRGGGFIACILGVLALVLAFLSLGSEGPFTGTTFVTGVGLLVLSGVQRRRRQRQLRELLSRIPEYAELLNRFPDAVVRRG